MSEKSPLRKVQTALPDSQSMNGFSSRWRQGESYSRW